MPKRLEDEPGSNSTECGWKRVQRKLGDLLGLMKLWYQQCIPEGNSEQYMPINELYFYKPQKVHRHFLKSSFGCYYLRIICDLWIYYVLETFLGPKWMSVKSNQCNDYYVLMKIYRDSKNNSTKIFLKVNACIKENVCMV